MNLALSDEQVLLREAARGALSRHRTLEAARAALDDAPDALPDLWATATEAGWPGLLIAESHGGAGLDAFDAMLVMQESGRVLASVPLLGHLPASSLLSEGSLDDALLADLASGQRRAAYLPARPPSDVEDRWSIDPLGGAGRPAAPSASRSDSRDGDGAGEQLQVSGSFHFVPDAPGADVLVGVALHGGDAVGFAVDAAAAGVEIEPITRYDATRPLGHVRLDGAEARLLDLDPGALAASWHLAQALIAAESVGAVETALETSVAYAKERFTFGRAIGSYQAVKHGLTEVLRQLENARSLLYYAGWARGGSPGEFALAANAARSVAGRALDHAARTMISVHGGIGATWEHDAPLYFRRAQLSRRLLGGTESATDRVAGELLLTARA
ncbi:MAG: acyl-CoA dehydrogenase family protein [Solirubrobacteraceae bacterium]